MIFVNVFYSVELKIPQLDGAFDSPKKKQSACKKSAIKANARSPSRSAKKYSPLDIVISKTATQQKTVLEYVLKYFNLFHSLCKIKY